MERASWHLLGCPGAGQDVEEAAAFARFLRRCRLRNEGEVGLHMALVPTTACRISLTHERTDEICTRAMRAWSGGGSTSFALDGFAVLPGVQQGNSPTGVFVSQHGWVEYWRQDFAAGTNAFYSSWVEEPARAVLTLGNLLLKHATAPPPQWLIAVAMTAASSIELRHPNRWVTGHCPNAILEWGTVVNSDGDLVVEVVQVMTGFARAFGWTVYDSDEQR